MGSGRGPGMGWLRNYRIVAVPCQVECRTSVVDDNANAAIGQRHVLAQAACCLIGVYDPRLDFDDVNVFDIVRYVFEYDSTAIADQQEILGIGARQERQWQQPFLSAEVGGCV